MPEPKPTPSTGEYADALSQIMDRDAEVRERASRPTPKKKKPLNSAALVAGLAVVFVVVWVGAFREMSAPPPPLSPPDTELNERIKTFAVAQQVRQFEEEHGRPPTSLDELGLGETGLTLVVEGDRWRVEETVDGKVVDAAKGEDPMAVIREMAEQAGGGGMR